MNKSNVQFTTYIGLIPFFLPFLGSLFLNDSLFLIKVREISLLYGVIIVAFISGMQWEVMTAKNLKFSFSPIVPFTLCWFYFFDLFIFFKETVIIISLLLNLMIDYLLLKNFREAWFKKMRLMVTVTVCLSLVANFFSI